MPPSSIAIGLSGRDADMASPVVSVVIPTYNHAQFLRAAIQSVLDQTFTDWEAIVVNNYSEDETAEIVASYDDPRIKRVDFHNHGIIAAARNHGIGLALGEFVAFLDSDDIWYPDKLKRCIEKLHEGNDVVCHGEAWVKAGRPPRRMYYGPQRRTSYLSLLYDGNCLSTSAIVVRKTALIQVDGFSEHPQMVTAEDYELWLKLAKAGCRIALVDEILGEYRIHGGNQSKAVMRNLQAELAVLEKHFGEIPRRGFISWLRRQRRFALAYYGAGRGMQAEGSHVDALRWFARSWITYPFIARAYAAILISLLAPIKQAIIVKGIK